MIPSMNPVIEQARQNLYHNPHKGEYKDLIEQGSEERIQFLEEELAKLEGETSELEDKNERDKVQKSLLMEGIKSVEAKREALRAEAQALRGNATPEADLLQILGTMQKEAAYSNRALLLKNRG